MDKATASDLIRATFQNPFDKGRFVSFTKNLLNTIDESKAAQYYDSHVPDKFRDFVKGYERVGTYTDPEGTKVDVLIVHLKSEATLARARTSQRNFIANYLKTKDAKDAGLIAFVSPNLGDWRFSFVKMDYKMVEKGRGFRAEEEFTPARRYSFLVGSHESSHTAQRQLLPILTDDTNNPTLDLIENAFNIETVTKEFFEEYHDLFLQMKKALDGLAAKNKAIRKDFEEKDVQTADFAKKLLGQIVFLYFLQKKGWFGVERDEAWGTGPKDFLRKLFEGKLLSYKNFFNDVLEPLFYEALAVERDANFYSKFGCKIPFLNGGLFDPINGYDWVHTDITLPNDLFSNDVKTKDGDIGTGILDFFDRYNFTVKEDEPLEKEVAVDPEMLGKVFENLLEVEERSEKGTYYTPREIVHYMCQESLINYLVTEMEDKVSKADIALLIRMGDTVIEHESRVVQKGEETDTYSFKLPESIRTHAVLIDQKLADIRVCDPAIGSGAFPVGMMNEIVRARQTLTSYFPTSDSRLPYDLKRHAIQESLYGVDIDPGAVEIAKLRLWLSLIVDEDDIGRIKPLPNLDYRIMQGNSLLEEFEGNRLFDEKLLETSAEDREMELTKVKDKMSALQQEYFSLHSEGKLTDTRKEEIESEIKRQKSILKQLQATPKFSENIGMFDTPSRVGEVLNELKALHRTFFEATQRKKKDEIKQKIESLEWELIEVSLTEKNKGNLLTKLKRARIRPFFLWKLYFFEVFQQRGGFDVVIANPPYVSAMEYLKLYGKSERDKLSSVFESAKGAYDLYVLFLELGIRLLKKNGNLVYINPNKFLSAQYGVGIRTFILENTYIQRIVDLSSIKIFAVAAVYPVLIFLHKKKPSEQYELESAKPAEREVAKFNIDKFVFAKISSTTLSALPEHIWGFLLSDKIELLLKFLNNTVPLESIGNVGATTTASEADEYGNFISETKTASSRKIINTGTIDSYRALWGEKPFVHSGKKFKKPYLDMSLPVITSRRKEIFEQPKIIFAKMAKNCEAFFDSSGDFASVNTNCFYMPKEDVSMKYLTAFFNSAMFMFFYQQFFGALRMSGGYFQFQAPQLRITPYKKPSKGIENAVEEYVDQILDAMGKKDEKNIIIPLLKKIDGLIFESYGVSEEEKSLIQQDLPNQYS